MSADVYKISMGMNERVGSCTVEHRCERTPTSETKFCDNAMQRRKTCKSNQTQIKEGVVHPRINLARIKMSHGLMRLTWVGSRKIVHRIRQRGMLGTGVRTSPQRTPSKRAGRHETVNSVATVATVQVVERTSPSIPLGGGMA